MINALPDSAPREPHRTIGRFVLIVTGVLLVISVPAVALLYHYQIAVLEQRLADEGAGILNAYVAQTQDSIEKGQPRTFQHMMDNIARLEGVIRAALYARSGLQTYRSGEITVGVPFVRGTGGDTVNPNQQHYRHQRSLRQGWNSVERIDSPEGRRHMAEVEGRPCGGCHYALDEHAQFDEQGRAHVIGRDSATFFHRLPVEAQCVTCHTHWLAGETAGYLGVTIATAGQRAEVADGIRRVIYVLLIIAGVVLAATVIIGWMYAKLGERGREVAEKRSKLASLLDNSDQGFLSFDEQLQVDSEYSRECVAIFGREPTGASIAGLLYAGDGEKARQFGRNVARILDETDEGKRELYLSLMPSELHIGEKTVQLGYRLLPGRRMMLVLTDVTTEKMLEERVREEQGRLRMIVTAAREPEDLFELLDDYRHFEGQELPRFLAGEGLGAEAVAEFYRRIHTFKGLFAQQEFIRLPAQLHALESALGQWKRGGAEQAMAPESLRAQIEHCAEALEWDLAVVRDALGAEFFERRGELRLGPEQVRMLEAIAARLLRKEVADLLCDETRAMVEDLRRLRYVDLRDLLSGYPPMVEQLAERLEKVVHPFVIEGECVRVAPELYQPFAKALVHLFRNCVDHGIENPEERLAAGKDEAGLITCRLSRRGDRLELEVSDDGRGIDVEALRCKAEERGFFTPDQTGALPEQAVLQAVFADEVSTRSEVSELSGRGVGLAVVKAELDRLGGSVTVSTRVGLGTAFRFTLPEKQPPARADSMAFAPSASGRRTLILVETRESP